jgi:uncharacterized protein
MRFWDSSAIMPLLIAEESSATMRRFYVEDPVLLVWWSTPVECASAVARLERQALLSTPAATEILQRLDALRHSWHQIAPVDAVREAARRLLRAHDLRAADALQLAAAWIVSEGRPSTLEVVCLDGKLSEAAQREGFQVVGPVQPQG